MSVAVGNWLTSMIGPSKRALRWLWSLTTLAMSTVNVPWVTVEPAIDQGAPDLARPTDRRRVLAQRGPPARGSPAIEPVPTFQVPAIDADEVVVDPRPVLDVVVGDEVGSVELGRGRALNEVDVHVGAQGRREDDDDGHARSRPESVCAAGSPWALIMTCRLEGTGSS